MKGFLNDRKVSCTLSALCFIALGVCLLVWPGLSRIWICRLLGAALLVTGGVYVISHFYKARGAVVVFQYDLVLGVVLAIAGVWLLTTPDLILTFIQYILGVILVVHGFIDLQGALNLRTGGSRQWKAVLIMALLTIGLGALVIFNPFATIDALLMLIGVALIFDGLSDLVIIFNLARTFRKLRKTAEEAAEELVSLAEEGDVIESEGRVEK